MLDTRTIARSLTDTKLTPDRADAITAAIREAAEHGDHVTVASFHAGLDALEDVSGRWRHARALARAQFARASR